LGIELAAPLTDATVVWAATAQRGGDE
jgi:hypothetical protein